MQTDMGAYIRDLRLARGWSQEGLARKAKTTRPEVTKAEGNPRPPTERMLARLVLAAGGDVEDAFERAQYGRQRAIYWMDTLLLAQPEEDPVTVIRKALDDGGWPRHVQRAIVTLVRATRPASALPELRTPSEC